MKRSNTYKYLFAVTVGTAAIVSAIPQAEAISFTDVDQLGNQAYQVEMKEAIYSLATRNIVNGIGPNTFAPNNYITRGEAAKIIALALNLPTTNVQNPNFRDVKTSDWYYPYVAALANRNIISGYNGYFNPSQQITRGDMAKIIATAFNLKTTSSVHPFKDIPVGHYSHPFVAALYNNEITFGVNATTFGYLDKVTRGQLALFTVRAENLKEDVATPNVGKKLMLKAADYGFKSFTSPTTDQSDVYNVTMVNGNLEITALNEGQGKLMLKGNPTASTGTSEAFYLVNVERINGQLQVALEKANVLEYIDYNSQYFAYRDLNIGFKPAIATLKKAGVNANDEAMITLDEAGFDMTIFNTGTYTLTLENGRESKTFTVEVKLNRFVTVIDIL